MFFSATRFQLLQLRLGCKISWRQNVTDKCIDVRYALIEISLFVFNINLDFLNQRF